MSCPEIVDDVYLKKGIKTTNAWNHIILHLVINLGAWWAGNRGIFGTGTWGPRDLVMWMPGNLRVWGPGECGPVNMCVWKPGDLGTCGTGDLRTCPLQYVECVASRVYKVPSFECPQCLLYVDI